MSELFRDAVWQFVGAILGLIAIIISVIIFFAQRKRKILAYEIVSKTSVVSAEDEIAGKIQILFEGKSISKVHLLVLKLVNSGNVPITSGDYEREVSFKFSEKVQVLTAEVSETTPENLNAEVSIVAEKSIAIKPILLNSGDTITIKSLISNFDDKVNIDGRIVGVKSISNRVENTTWGYVLIIVIGMIMSGSVALFNNKALASPTFPSDSPLSFALFMFGYLLVLFGIARSNRLFRKFLTLPFDLVNDVIKRLIGS